jgi:Family of unknown function (DUF5681)
MPKRRSKSPPTHYDVGYRKPPKQSQFKKGQIGNPEGVNRKASASPDLKVIVERELNAKVKLRRGEADQKITKGAAGIKRLVDRYANGDSRALRDLILLCDKAGVPLTDRKALEGALEDALSAEDEALLTDFVRRHGGQYPVRAETVPNLLDKDQKLLGPAAEEPKLLPPRPENSTSP